MEVKNSRFAKVLHQVLNLRLHRSFIGASLGLESHRMFVKGSTNRACLMKTGAVAVTSRPSHLIPAAGDLVLDLICLESNRTNASRELDGVECFR